LEECAKIDYKKDQTACKKRAKEEYKNAVDDVVNAIAVEKENHSNNKDEVKGAIRVLKSSIKKQTAESAYK
jgi:hypothetical protein